MFNGTIVQTFGFFRCMFKDPLALVGQGKIDRGRCFGQPCGLLFNITPDRSQGVSGCLDTPIVDVARFVLFNPVRSRKYASASNAFEFRVNRDSRNACRCRSVNTPSPINHDHKGMKSNWNRGLKFAMFVALAGAVSSLLVMVLWNWLMPTLFGLPSIDFWQALGLLILTRILFGRFRGNHFYRRWRMKQRWKQMTPEERDSFRKG